MPVDNLYECARRPFLEAAPDISGALVYLDAGAGEVASTSLGLSFLLGLGATHVGSLEDASPRDALLPTISARACGGSDPPAGMSLAVFVTRMVTDAHTHITRAVRAHSTSVQRVTIFSSVSEHAHACQAATELGVDAFSEYAAMLKQSVKDVASPVVSVRHLPMHMCVLQASVAMLPAASGAAMFARAGGAAAGLSAPDARDAAPSAADGEGASGGLSLLAHEIGGLVHQMGAKCEAFAVGPTAQLLASEVLQLPLPPLPQLIGRPSPTVALILVDRALDLVGPCSHGDHAADLMVSMAPRSGSDGDVDDDDAASPDPAPDQHARSAGEPIKWRACELRASAGDVAPDSLAPHDAAGKPPPRMGLQLVNPGDRTAMARLTQLVHAKRSKDALQLLRKWLKEALRSESLTPSVRSKAGSAELISELSTLISDLGSAKGEHGKGSVAVRQRGVLALAAAAVSALSDSLSERWHAAAALERTSLMMMVQAGDTSGLHQTLLDALSNAQAGKGPLRVSDVLQLLPYIYSLWPDAAPPQEDASSSSSSGGPFSHQEEKELLQAVGKALMSVLVSDGWATQLDCLSPNTLRRMHQMCLEPGGEGRKAAQKEARSVLQAYFARLAYVARARMGLPTLQRFTQVDMFGDDPISVTPLLRRIARATVQRAELPDVVHVSPSGALGGLISKGLGHFGLGSMLGAGRERPTQPWQCDAVLVFVVGGLSLAEVRDVRQELDEAAGSDAAGRSADSAGGGGGGTPQVLLAGTALVSPVDIARQLLVRKGGGSVHV